MIGKNIRTIRERRGLTQSDLADKLQISDKTVSSWEVGRTEPGIAMIDRLAAVLRCAKAELIGDVLVLSYSEKEYLEKYRALDETQKEMILASIDAAYAATKKESARFSA